MATAKRPRKTAASTTPAPDAGPASPGGRAPARARSPTPGRGTGDDRAGGGGAAPKRAGASPRRGAGTTAGPGASPFASVSRLARELRALTGTVLGVAGNATDLSLALARSRLTDPRAQDAIGKAGEALRRARTAAGVTTKELGAAIDLSDPELLEQAEKGKIALPFEVILRLAAVLGRNDPVTFAMRLMRSYRPDLWQALDDAGVGRLVVQAGRERELANLYRANDAARRLSDAEFARVLRFTEAAFDMAVQLHVGEGRRAPKG